MELHKHEINLDTHTHTLTRVENMRTKLSNKLKEGEEALEQQQKNKKKKKLHRK